MYISQQKNTAQCRTIASATTHRRTTLLGLLLDDLATTNTTSTTGSDETDLATGRCSALDGRRVTDVLMVTTTVGMLHGVHRHTSHLRPAVTLDLVLVVRTAGLQDRLVNTATAGNDADHGAVRRRHHLLGAGRQLDARLLCVRVVRDDGGVVAGRAGQTAAVAGLLLQVAHDGSLRHGAQRHHVADLQVSLAAAVQELAGVHALGGDEQLLADLVAVGVAEVHKGERRTTAGVVHDLLRVGEGTHRLISLHTTNLTSHAASKQTHIP